MTWGDWGDDRDSLPPIYWKPLYTQAFKTSLTELPFKFKLIQCAVSIKNFYNSPTYDVYMYCCAQTSEPAVWPHTLPLGR